MADTEEPRPQSIQDRIAALNVGHVRTPNTVNVNKRPPPPKPPLQRSNTASLPTNGIASQPIGNQPDGEVETSKTVLPPPTGIIRTGQQTNGRSKPPPPPRVPPRSASTVSKPSPALPPRRPSEQQSRRGSQDSVSSAISSISSVSNGTTTTSTFTRKPSMDTGRMRAPAYDPSSLPPLPPKKTQEEKDAALKPQYKGRQVSSDISTNSQRDVKTPVRPPTLPQRTNTATSTPDLERPQEPPRQPPRRLPPTTIPPVPRSVSQVPASRHTPSHGLPTPESTPPPIPASTRPDLSKLMATKPKMPAQSTASAVTAPATTDPNSCLVCRDFSAVDAHAARFPREQVPSIAWLASQLCDPFPSATDKARAIFTWEHHNINYNTHDFFNNCVKGSTPASTLETGLAVCEGYAALFAALAALAGLEALVVTGHGKGYGYNAPGPGEACPPPNPTGHAWNAVRIDGGSWKLLDPCWGAGHICGSVNLWKVEFHPGEFTDANEDFGRRHFPSNPSHFFRPDGRALSWDEYVLGPTPGVQEPQTYGMISEEGFRKYSLLPADKRISSSPHAHSGPTLRFQMQRSCAHWDPRRNGKGLDYVYVVDARGKGDNKPGLYPMETNGNYWWADVPVDKLGPAGSKVQIMAIKSIGGLEGRGLSVDEFRSKLGRTGWGGSYLAGWEVV